MKDRMQDPSMTVATREPVGLVAGPDERLRFIFGPGSRPEDGVFIPSGTRVERLDMSGRVAAVSGLDLVLSTIAAVGAQTPVLTARGTVAAEEVREGDLLPSDTGEPLRVERVDLRDFGWALLGVNPFLRPLKVAANAFSDGCPAREIVLAQGAWVWVPEAKRAPGRRLVQAIDLPRMGLAQPDESAQAKVVRFGLSRAGRICCAGIWVEASSASSMPPRSKVRDRAPRHRSPVDSGLPKTLGGRVN